MAGRLTTTSYCLLGLLDLRPFSAYDLTKYMQRSALAELWPRTETAIYRETRRLAEAGLAEVSTERQGNRSRSVYSINDLGRRALRDWLDEPGASLSFECEAAVKAFFGSATDLEGVRAQLAALRADFESSAEQMEPVLDAWLRGDLPFPDRLHYTAMAVDLISRLRSATDAWAADWLDRVAHWKGTKIDQMSDDQARETIESLRRAAQARMHGQSSQGK